MLKHRILTFAAAAAIALFTVAPAGAVTLTWELRDWLFSDGGTASGSYDYDADTDTFSAINITTTAGSVRSGDTYITATALANAGFLDFLGPDTGGAGFSGDARLFTTLAADMTNMGGTIGLDLTGGVLTKGEGNCVPTNCGTLTAWRAPVSGSVISAVPLPASALLLVAALVGLGYAGRRRNA